MQTSEVQQFAKEYDEKFSDIMKDEQNILALDNIEQSHLLEDPDLWKEFHKSIKASLMRIYVKQIRMMTLREQNVNNTTTNKHQIQLRTHT